MNGAVSDRAAIEVHDIGLEAVKNEAGELGFRVSVGGGLGRTPIVGSFINEFLPWQHLLGYQMCIRDRTWCSPPSAIPACSSACPGNG